MDFDTNAGLSHGPKGHWFRAPGSPERSDGQGHMAQPRIPLSEAKGNAGNHGRSKTESRELIR